MSEEVELAAKATGEVVSALAEASGAMGPPQEFWGAVADGIHYRFYPRTVKQALAAAQKIKQLDLPRRAYSEIPDPLLKAILEAGAIEDDAEMQIVWANLLVNALTDRTPEVHPAYPKILSELRPVEARLLDRIFDAAHISAGAPWDQAIVQVKNRFQEELGLSVEAFDLAVDNLARLHLVALQRADGAIRPDFLTHIKLTPVGRALVLACRAPEPPSPD